MSSSHVQRVRSRIHEVELAMRDAGTENALHAIVSSLKEIANALEQVETDARNNFQRKTLARK